MRFVSAIDLAVRGVRAKPTRTFLTLLGVAIGVSAVMIIASLGEGARRLITDEIAGLGADVIAIQPGREPTGLADVASTFYSETLTNRDLEALRRKENVPHAVDAQPMVVVPGAVSFDTETYYPQIVGGSAAFYEEMFDIHPAEGEMFGETEIKEKAAIAVIGHKVNQELFGDSSGYGQKITIRGKKFRVSGVMPKLGQVAFAQIDDMVLVPYTTAQTYLLGQTHFNEIIVRVDSPEHMPRTEQDIEETMREAHDLKENEENDFVIRTPAALLEQVGAILGALTIFLVSVVATALVTGGIGIMNIMLVSVAERTREIGLRKAVGATDGDILTQFLLEAILLTFLGGLAGILFGALVSYVASLLIVRFSALDWTFVLPLDATLAALVFSVLIGLVFGLYPARKASKKSPMEALRYE